MMNEVTMKTIIALILSTLPVVSHARLVEVECTGSLSNGWVKMEIETPPAPKSPFRRAIVIFQQNGQETFGHYTLTQRGLNSSSTIIYRANGLRLEVDMWPDQSPQAGKNYPSILVSPGHSSTSIQNLSCIFPQV